MATYANIFVDQGSDFSMTVDLVKSVGSLDLTNYTGRGEIRKTYTSTTKTSFTISVDSSANELVVSLTAAQTAAIKAGRYVYDIEILSGDSTPIVTRVLEGQLEVTPRVTTGS
tara:strand:- start:784 stop:1122 length:339 start_codon:yes stop_codon:yes gene_type:complete